MTFTATFRLFTHPYCRFFLLFGILTSCTTTGPTRIAVSKASDNYINWLKRSDSTLEIINMYALTTDSARSLIGRCDGLLVTGGDDVYPGWYGQEADTARCTGFDRRRDTLDMALIARAFELKMPVFGVCRGHQIINVYLGGKLVIDVPSDFPEPETHQCDDYLNCFHSVAVSQNTQLARISGCDSAVVTTNHHQAVADLAPFLKISAWSKDRLPEAIEWIDPEGKSFLLGVQWHPERMDKTNPLSGPLAGEFIRQAVRYSQQHKN